MHNTNIEYRLEKGLVVKKAKIEWNNGTYFLIKLYLHFHDTSGLCLINLD